MLDIGTENFRNCCAIHENVPCILMTKTSVRTSKKNQTLMIGGGLRTRASYSGDSEKYFVTGCRAAGGTVAHNLSRMPASIVA
jgi:hypothetical protein